MIGNEYISRAKTLRDTLGLLTQDELAHVLEVTPDTLREWRRLKQGPDFVKTGKNVMYRHSDVLAWIKLNVVPVARCAVMCGLIFMFCYEIVWSAAAPIHARHRPVMDASIPGMIRIWNV